MYSTKSLLLDAYVEILWRDSTHTSGWHTSSENSDFTCCTVGILLESPDDRVTVVQNYSPYCIGEIMEIPIESVVSIRLLK